MVDESNGWEPGPDTGDDPLGGELRSLFADDRLSLPVPAGAAESVVVGARRRRVRRIAAAAGGGVLVIAIGVLAGVGLTGIGRPASTNTAEPGLVISVPAATSSVPPASTANAGPPDSLPSSSSRPDHDHPPTTATTAPPATSTAPVVSGGLVAWPVLIGPAGYGPLRLGMSEQAALATGMIDPASRSGGVCASYAFARAGSSGDQSGVQVQETGGLVAIVPPPAAGAVRTPEGVGVGSTVPQLQAAYPDLTSTSGGDRVAQVPGRSGYVYDFQLGGKTAAVARVELIDTGQQCSNSGGG